MTTLDTIIVTCPNCSAKVEFTVIMSTNFMAQDTDFRRITNGISPRSVMLSTCRKCGFTGDRSDFDGTVDAAVSAMISERITPVVFDEDPDSPRRWEFAALLAEARGKPAVQIADHYLNGAWCIRDDGGDPAVEEFFRRKAAEKFEEHLAGNEEVEDRPAITYLIGELYRRVGDKTTADRWYDDALAQAAGDPELAWLTGLAQQQKTHPQQNDR
jgi:uncharacterized protein (DUF2225 family)